MFYPAGGFAQNVVVDVTLFGSNMAPALFTDPAGTVPKPDPVTTDANGLLSFYASPGVYRVEYAGEQFFVDLDPAEPSEVVAGQTTHVQSSPATVWTVAHHFGTEPSVDVRTDQATAEPVVEYLGKDSLTITFNVPATGTATLRR